MKYGELTAKAASDLGYLPATVLVDGIPAYHCMVFDDIRGWADVGVLDYYGHLKIDLARNDIETVRIYGQIEYISNLNRKDFVR